MAILPSMQGGNPLDILNQRYRNEARFAPGQSPADEQRIAAAPFSSMLNIANTATDPSITPLGVRDGGRETEEGPDAGPESETDLNVFTQEQTKQAYLGGRISESEAIQRLIAWFSDVGMSIAPEELARIISQWTLERPPILQGLTPQQIAEALPFEAEEDDLVEAEEGDVVEAVPEEIINFLVPSARTEAGQLEELSATRWGRGKIFDRFLAAQPAFQFQTPGAQRAMQQRFDPLSASFILQGLTNESGTPRLDDFRAFLQDDPSDVPAENFLEQFRLIAPAFDPEAQRSGTLSAQQEAVFDYLNLADPDPDEVASNLIAQSIMGGMHPILARMIPNIISRRIAAFRNEDLTTPAFQEFVNRDLNF